MEAGCALVGEGEGRRGGGARELTCRSGRPSPSRGPSPAFISWRHRPGGKHCGYARAMTKAQAYSGSQKREKKQA